MADEFGEPIGRGLRAEVFARGDRALKLYAAGEGREKAFREAAILAAVAPLGLPAPAVEEVRRYNGRWGVLMSRADGPSFAKAMQTAAIEPVLDEMVRLHRAIHAHPAPPSLPAHKTRLAAAIRRAPSLTENRRRMLIADLAALPDGDRLCHGDFHPMNLIGAIGRAMIVDWLDASAGHPAADLCRSFALMQPVAPDIAEAYLARYCAAAPLARDEVMAWLPVIAAARLAEGPTDAAALMKMIEGN